MSAVAMTEAELVDRQLDRLLETKPPTSTPPEELWRAQFDHGLAWVHFPVGCGGLGAARRHQETVDATLRAAGVPSNVERNIIGLGMGAPVLVAHGTDEQRARHLRSLFACDEIWCQLFSEPGAGSDVANLATSARRDGDSWVVNGQKVWTSLAHVSRWGMLVARTDPAAPKHRGLTYFVLDMHAPGVEVRPLRQLTGDAEFNEVYLTDVRIPDTDRLGEVGRGWDVVLTTLMNERVAIGGTIHPRGGGPIVEAVALWRDGHGGGPVLRDRLARLWIEAECVRLTARRAAASQQRGTPGPEGSVGKLTVARLEQAIYELCVDLLGADALLYPSYEMRRPDRVQGGDVKRAFLRSRATSIEGGTSEVMANILGERVLGLPGDVRVDRDGPWQDSRGG